MASNLGSIKNVQPKEEPAQFGLYQASKISATLCLVLRPFCWWMSMFLVIFGALWHMIPFGAGGGADTTRDTDHPIHTSTLNLATMSGGTIFLALQQSFFRPFLESIGISNLLGVVFFQQEPNCLVNFCNLGCLVAGALDIQRGFQCQHGQPASPGRFHGRSFPRKATSTRPFSCSSFTPLHIFSSEQDPFGFSIILKHRLDHLYIM
jgi:hypothetical protein